ncbi:hypothetical protein AAHC03_017258 [Spirometra sp. Aus1]
MKSMLVTALLVSVAFVDAYNIIYEVPMNANFDFVIRVDASSSLILSDSEFVECPLDEDCWVLNVFVQFLPRRRSLQIYGHPNTQHARIALIPIDAGLQNLIVAISGSANCNHKPFSPTSTESVCAKRDFMKSLTLVVDEDIKEIVYEGLVSTYPKNTVAVDGVEVFVPYEQINGEDYKLLRISGKIGDTSVSFILKNPAGVETNYVVQPVNNLQVQCNPVRFIRWQKRRRCV